MSRHAIRLCLFVVLPLFGCAAADDGAADVVPDAGAWTLRSFVDGAWELRADRAWDRDSGEVQFPNDPLDEEGFVPLDAPVAYAIALSSDGTRIEIVEAGAQPVTGQLHASTSSIVEFDLSGGLFAGGRFVAWVGPGGLQSEYTIYGSGVPIIGSVRGALVPAPAP
jgi:hypothetical protein